MSCVVEKRHGGYRGYAAGGGAMLHHRFPNGFADLLMDEMDREVSTLTDRAFRSLCVGDDAVYNDELTYGGYSPFSCTKPLVEEPVRKASSRKQGTHQGPNPAAKDAGRSSWKQTQEKRDDVSDVSCFLQALGDAAKSRRRCDDGMPIRNGDFCNEDSNGESWDKSALRSIRQELSEFSSDYRGDLAAAAADGHFGRGHNRHHRGAGPSSGDDSAGKAAKVKNGKAAVKLKKLNIKNLFLHSELSPFQAWRDFNRFPFRGEPVASMLPTDSAPTWYDSAFYKELTDQIETHQQGATEAPPRSAAAAKPAPPPPPPKLLPKPSMTPAQKRCSSDVGEACSAPWRRHRTRAQSAVPAGQSGILSPPRGGGATGEERRKGEEVEAREEISSSASTPFSICQLMTPLIPSRQNTQTSEILELTYRPDSEPKVTPEPPVVKRDNYKSLASSVLFNLKDNRKRVKSRYTPPRFRTSELPSELPDRGTQSPTLDPPKTTQAEEGSASGLSTPAILIDGQAVCSPVSYPSNPPTVVLNRGDNELPTADDYLISNLLQTKGEAAGSRSVGEENHYPLLLQSRKNKSPNKQSYPSLNLYKKASPIDNEIKHFLVPPLGGADSLSPLNTDDSVAQNKGLPTYSKTLSPHAVATNTGLSPNTAPNNASNIAPNTASKTVPNSTPIHKVLSPKTNTSPIQKGLSPNVAPIEKGLSPNVAPVQKVVSPNIAGGSKVLSAYGLEEKDGVSLNLPGNKRHSAGLTDYDIGPQSVSSKEKDVSVLPKSTMDVIRAAKEAIHAVKNKALSATQSESNQNTLSDEITETRERDSNKHGGDSTEMFINNKETSVTEIKHTLSPNRTQEATTVSKNCVKKDPPPVPKRSFAKSDIQHSLENQPVLNDELDDTKQDVPVPNANDKEPNVNPGRFKHVFSARQNNYIKSQRYVTTEDEQEIDREEGGQKTNTKVERREEVTTPREINDSDHIINDLQALKELERARFSDRIIENAKNKLSAVNIEEETKAKNDLISRELKNIKRGMMSMRGNTFTKRDATSKREESKHQMFSQIDSNVVVNKALINNNYDRAKMALEEIISERLKNKFVKEEEGEGNSHEDSYVARAEHPKKALRDSATEVKERQNGSVSTLREKDARGRLGDLHLKQILLQSEAKLGDAHWSSAKAAPPGVEKVNKELVKQTNQTKPDEPVANFNHTAVETGEDSKRHVVRRAGDENREIPMNRKETDGKKKDAPPVPPRSKKGVMSREDSITAEAEHEQEFFVKDKTYLNVATDTKKETKYTESGKQEQKRRVYAKDLEQSQISSNNRIWDNENIEKTKHVSETLVPEYVRSPELHHQSKNKPSPLPTRADRRDEIKAGSGQPTVRTASEAKSDHNNSCNSEQQEQRKVKRKAPLKPDNLISAERTKQDTTTSPEGTATATVVSEEPNETGERFHEDEEVFNHLPGKTVSPVLLLNGVHFNQSPPDQGSLSSKSSYFSVESALHRNSTTESNIYHSLENLDDLDDLSGTLKRDSDKNEQERYYSVSDQETEPEVGKQTVVSPLRGKEALWAAAVHDGEQSGTEMDNAGVSRSWSDDADKRIAMSPASGTMSPLTSSTFSPVLGVPVLFKVKDNTVINKAVRPVHPFSPRENPIGLEWKGEAEVHHMKDNPLPPRDNETTTSSSGRAKGRVTDTADLPGASFKHNHTLRPLPPLAPLSPPQPLNLSPPQPLNLSPPQSLNLSPPQLSDSQKKSPLCGVFLTVPRCNSGRVSGESLLSEGVESSLDASDGTPLLPATPADEVDVSSKVPSERSGSPCSTGNDSQSGLPRPPVVLPKSEKALLKAMKLANRRIRKEEAQAKSSNHRSSRVGGRHRGDKHTRPDGSEQKSSEQKSSEQKSSERKSSGGNHNERTTQSPHDGDKSSNRSERRGSHGGDSHQGSRLDLPEEQSGRRRSGDGERRGRSGEKHTREKPEHRHYSTERVFSNVPVYKSHVGERRPAAERPFQRSQSFDRSVGDKKTTERRLSTDTSTNESATDSRARRIERSIMDELQLRGRARDRPTDRDKRSHSIDTSYVSDVSYSHPSPHPSNVSRQSSTTGGQLSRQSSTTGGQLSRQSSMEPTTIMTQRKLLQDPDSGQYFFVDMPVQVKTKTFFDPETGSYVQLPVQPSDGSIPQASPMELLNTPVVVYHHRFVPVALSSAQQVEPEYVPLSSGHQGEPEYKRSGGRPMRGASEGCPYLEPVYGQADLLLGEFYGTEELDCAG